MSELRCRYLIETITAAAIVLRDVGHDEGRPTITGDVESVVERMRHAELLDGRRLYYFDSDGRLDEIVLDGDGQFHSFRPAPALEAILRPRPAAHRPKPAATSELPWPPPAGETSWEN